jgi:hypothetical protein
MLGQIYRTHRVSVKRERIESIGPDLGAITRVRKKTGHIKVI